MGIAIIAILASMLIPALSKARVKARTIDCVSRHKQIMLGTMIYAEDNDGLLPRGYIEKEATSSSSVLGLPSAYQVKNSSGANWTNNICYFPGILRKYVDAELWACPAVPMPCTVTIKWNAKESWIDYKISMGINYGRMSSATRIDRCTAIAAVPVPAGTYFYGCSPVDTDVDDPEHLSPSNHGFGSTDCMFVGHANWKSSGVPTAAELAAAVPRSRCGHNATGMGQGLELGHDDKSNYAFIDGHVETIANINYYMMTPEY